MDKFFQKGLTLIELMTVVAMVIIVTGIVFANYGTGQNNMALERSSQKLYQDLRFAVSNSMSGIEGNYGNGIHFDIDTTGSIYKYLIFKNPIDEYTFTTNSTNIFPSRGVDVNSDNDWVKLENGVKIVSFKNKDGGTADKVLDVFFRSPYPTTFLNGTYYQNSTDCSPQTNCTVSITLSTNDGTNTKTITINNAGMIDLK
ncbi:MAG: hypothetical protein PHR47_02110 [Candidatus Pacebacteria bacterium]|nr:hypothetical protein [Candidatus Paceibacterota bacterium]